MSGGRVALITEVVAPYRIPVFNELSDRLNGALHVFFTQWREGLGRDWQVRRDEIQFDYSVLGGTQIAVPYRGDRQPVYLAPPLLPRLVHGAFDAVVVGGWSHLECVWAVAYTSFWRRHLVLWSETPLLGMLPRRTLRSAWKRAVIARSDAFIVPGPSAGRYLEAHGASSAQIRIAPNAVDVNFWGLAPEHRDAYHPRPVMLYVGRLVRSKGLDVALRAFGESRLAGRATMLVAGDGPERDALERLAPRGVQFLGSQSSDTLRCLYHSADLLLFPSRYDPWGLVLNEAACAGLAAIASDAAGATQDLLRDGVNGLVVRGGDIGAFRAALDRVADDPTLPSRLGAAARRITKSHAPATCAAGIAAAVNDALGRVSTSSPQPTGGALRQ